MILRCFYSSPLRSHPAYGVDPRAGIYDAARRLSRFAQPSFKWLFSVFDVRACPTDCIWSPLMQGDVIRGEIEHYSATPWEESEALGWCLHSMRYHGFNTLIIGSVQRAADYGANGVDRERALADSLGLRVMSEADLEAYLARS